MNKFFLILLGYLIAVNFSVSCNEVESQATFENDTNNNISVLKPVNTVNHTSYSVEMLCNNIKEIKVIPYYYDEVADDPIYDGLIEKGKEAIPCLIDKITDTTPMKDPGTAPKVQDFKVGDAAVFILLLITKEEWQPETMFPSEYAKHWKTEGVYTYFAYVENPENRKKVQLWWKNWMKNNLK